MCYQKYINNARNLLRVETTTRTRVITSVGGESNKPYDLIKIRKLVHNVHRFKYQKVKLSKFIVDCKPERKKSRQKKNIPVRRCDVIYHRVDPRQDRTRIRPFTHTVISREDKTSREGQCVTLCFNFINFCFDTAS